jgi:hypothetical protein
MLAWEAAGANGRWEAPAGFGWVITAMTASYLRSLRSLTGASTV